MAGQGGGVNMDQFELYFRRADLDHDGKISGAEAVSFFQGSNLPKQVLAQIWMHADQSHNGFLSRQEFYNALKLVTVAQSKRELTPDIVKAALFGPASAKIPAPQINLSAIPAPQPNPTGAMPSPQTGAVVPTASQNLGFRGQVPPNASLAQQQYLHSQSNQSIRPPLPLPSAATSRPQQGLAVQDFSKGRAGMVGPGLQSPNISNEWLGGRTSGVTAGPTAPVPNRGTSPSMSLAAPKPQDPLSTSSLMMASKDPKAAPGSGNGFARDSVFGSDMFSASQSLPKQASPLQTSSPSSVASSTAIVPVESQTSSKPDPFEVLQSTYTRLPTSQQTQAISKPSQQVSPQLTSSTFSSGSPAAGVANSVPEQSEMPWPKMTRAGVQRYTKVFVEVDTDRDGRITGEQARNLFLSWRLPREVLKQVWDLSDQDNDSMLSLREFCVALYLMERYREGRPLPSTLPSSIMLDETLLSLAGPPAASYGSTGWGPSPGLRPPQMVHGNQPFTPAGLRPQPQNMSPQADGSIQLSQQTAKGASAENLHPNQLSNGEPNLQATKGHEGVEPENKVENKEKVLLDSREKIEFYRTKMQDLVLYKSRCDNRLNEITERALADKREAELLGKKYEEKYKQVAEIASKLTIEEASFRDIQERKMELNQAIVKMEQGGSADGILQVRADRIQSDLEELLRALSERCKKRGFHVKSTALIELPPGWQPGVPEIAAVWDEEWDKFEDEGFSFDVAVPANGKSESLQKESSSPTTSFSPDSLSNADAKSEKVFDKDVGGQETDSMYMHSEDESKSAKGSPNGQADFDSPTQDNSNNHFDKGFEADSEIYRSFDEPSWGTFDNNDDLDSVWGFNAKDSDHDKHGESEKYFFRSDDFGADSVRADSPRADSAFHKSSAFNFEDSVPGTPGSRAGNSPRYSVGSVDPFDSFSRFDSFSTHDRPSSPRRDTLTRFDSISSTTGFDHNRGFSFDESDPFGSSGPFKVSSESHSPKKGSDNWNSF